MRIHLLELDLMLSDRLTGTIKDQEPRRGRAIVNCSYESLLTVTLLAC